MADPVTYTYGDASPPAHAVAEAPKYVYGDGTPAVHDDPGLATRVLNSANKGLSDFLAAPGNIARALIGKTTGYDIGDPTLGADMLTQASRTKAFDPHSTVERYAQSVAQAAGSNAVPLGGVLGGGLRVAEAAVNPVAVIAREAAADPAKALMADLGGSIGQGIGGQGARDEFPGNSYADALGQVVGGLGGGMVGGLAPKIIGDTTPRFARLSPEEEAHYADLLHNGSEDDILNFFKDKPNLSVDPEQVKSWVAGRENPEAKGEITYIDGEPTSAPGPVGPPTAVDKLRSALKDAVPVREKQDELISQSRSEKLKDVVGVQKSTSGEAGFHAELSQLKGAADRVDFPSIRDNFGQADVDELFDTVKNSPELSVFDKINARKGLAKLLSNEGGQVPTENEIALLSKALPKDVIDEINKPDGIGPTLRDHISNGLNLPRSIMSSFDLSAPFRQGIGLMHKKEFWNSFGSMFKQFGSEEAFQAAQEAIKADPNYPLMKQGKLDLTTADTINHREEAFMSSWAEKIPVIGRGVRASDRAYTGFLNKVRADTFSSLVRDARKSGIDFEENPKALRDIAKFINTATGRGELGSTLGKSGPLLNGLFFSPRLMKSRVDTLNPAYYVNLDPFARKEALKSLLATGGIITTVLGLAHAGGASVETDPRSSDFAKIKDGNTRYDVAGGYSQYLRLAAEMATNEKKTTQGDVQELGKKYGSDTRLDVLLKFLQSKESPVTSFVTDYLRGKDYAGEPFSTRKEVASRFVPMVMQDMIEVYKDQGAKGVAKSIVPDTFGVGVQTYQPKHKKDTVTYEYGK